MGRFDAEDEGGVHPLEVGVHGPDHGASKGEYLRRSVKFGVRADRKHMVVPKATVARITPLGELSTS